MSMLFSALFQFLGIVIMILTFDLIIIGAIGVMRWELKELLNVDFKDILNWFRNLKKPLNKQSTLKSGLENYSVKWDGTK